MRYIYLHILCRIQLYSNNDSQTIQSQNKSHIGAAVNNNTNGSSRIDATTSLATLVNKSMYCVVVYTELFYIVFINAMIRYTLFSFRFFLTRS